MLKVGLTGTIGSGKSTVAKIFASIGVPIFNSDLESKQLLHSPEIIQQLTALFGTSILDEEGAIRRAALAAIVFNDPASLNQLNSILHPLVRKKFHSWSLRYQSEPYILNEAAILFESGFYQEFDLMIHISCPPEISIQRVIQRDGASAEDVLKRMHFQWSDEEKATKSDFVILNDGLSMVIPQVLRVHQSILERSSHRND